MDQSLLIKIQFFSTGLVLGISMLHLILYIYWRNQKSNFFYSLFLLFLAAAIFSDFQQLVTNGFSSLLYLKLQRASLSLSLISGLLFFYKLFGHKISKHFWLLAMLLLVTGIISVIHPIDNFIYLEIAIILALADIIHLTYRALGSARQWLGVIVIGFFIFALFASYDLLLDLGLIQPFMIMSNAYQFGVIGLIITTSIYLARDISTNNQKVIEQEKDIIRQKLEHQMLRQETERTKKELEEARNLQISMLPDQLPNIDYLTLSARMRTAAEVGGDYYDFHEFEDNRLTVVIGDATGHGNKAGFMVAIIKSFFKSYLPNSDFPNFFNNVTRILKQMNLGTLFMALTCIEVHKHILKASAAGMPPILVHRNESNTIEEYVIKGMPLGAVNDFPYNEIQIELHDNDTVLLVSDGLHELFNNKREMFGWDRVISTFKNNAYLDPEGIIDSLENEANAWRGDTPIGDDITYIVMKYLEPSSI